VEQTYSVVTNMRQQQRTAISLANRVEPNFELILECEFISLIVFYDFQRGQSHNFSMRMTRRFTI